MTKKRPKGVFTGVVDTRLEDTLRKIYEEFEVTFKSDDPDFRGVSPDTETKLPEPHTEYHRDPKHGLSIFEFVRIWIDSGNPVTKTVWRDAGGGWIRWVWFSDKTGHCHALFIPSYSMSEKLTGKETECLTTLRSGEKTPTKIDEESVPQKKHVAYQIKKFPGDLLAVEGSWKEIGLGSRKRIRAFPDGLVIEELDRVCPDCGQSFPNPFMVQDSLWEEYGIGKGVLCFQCFEKRLGRKLVPSDLKPCPIMELALRMGEK
ncbi:MAG: hypothetical protein WC824_12455 [Bacteroidota bacterium]|jgi:hypothetical protein